MESKLDFIRRIIFEIGFTHLSSRLGKYHTIVHNSDTIVVISLEGEYGYDLWNLEELDEDVINLIYEDLKTDFE